MRYAASGRRSGSSSTEAFQVNDCRQTPSWVLGESGHGAIVIPRGHMATATPEPSAAHGRAYPRSRALRRAVLLVLAVSGSWPAVAGTAATSTDPRATGRAADAPAAALRVVYFHSPTCHDCHSVQQALPGILARYGPKVRLERRSLDDADAFAEMLLYEQHYQARIPSPPAVCVGSRCLVGVEPIVNQLGDAIVAELAKGAETFCPPRREPQESDRAYRPVPDRILSRFESFGVGAVAVAGLIDGVNPCAFTTIVFFLSMLAYLKKTRREMLAVGAGFTVGMFAAYFLLGLGLLGAVKSFSVSSGLSSGLACGVAILAFALAGWSLFDAVRCLRAGGTKQATLGLPKRIKDRIHKVIRTGLTTRGLVVGSLSVGFLVSILESLCTGQVYLPTIVFVTRVPHLRAAAVAYLLLYNVMFILPLVAILAVTYLGVRSETLGNLLRKRLALAKLGMGVFFVGLGILVMITLS